MKILIAEDDANTRRGLAQILDGEGYETVEAADGRLAGQGAEVGVVALGGQPWPDEVVGLGDHCVVDQDLAVQVRRVRPLDGHADVGGLRCG